MIVIEFWSIHISEQGNANVNLFASALTNVGSQCSKSRMRIDDTVSNVITQGDGTTYFCRRHRTIVAHRAEHGKRRHCRSNFVFTEHCQHSLAAESHVSLNTQQIGRISSVWSPRGRFYHPSTILRHESTTLGHVLIEFFFTVQLVHNLLATQSDSNFLALVIKLKYPILDFVAPQKIVTFEVFDTIVGRYKLVHSCSTNVSKILLRIVPAFGCSNF
mmetsp:Transcript_420/g.636  ORF Transcript_420/g.636 Transcript_420/m.636 type:complete len:217 (+) Transcript_420:2185-2835(+)